MKTTAAILASLLFCSGWQPAIAQQAFSKPVRVIVPYPPASPLDTLMRQFGQELTRSSGQPLVVDNRPGGNNVIAMSACAKSPADGYNFCLIDRSTTMLPYLYKQLPFDLEKDFVPVTQLVYTTLALVAHPSAGAASFKDLIAVARARPGALNYGSLGPASMPSLLMEWLKKRYGLDITHVPYKGPPPLMQAVLAGETQITYLALVNFVGYHKAGKIRILGVSGAQRSPLVPDVPTLAEQGLNELDISVWFGLFAPAGTPKDGIERMYREVVRVFALPAFRDRQLTSVALEPIANAPEEFARFLRNDKPVAAELIRISGAHLD